MLRAVKRDTKTGTLYLVPFFRLIPTSTGRIVSRVYTETGLRIVRTNTQRPQHPLAARAIAVQQRQTEWRVCR